MTLKIGQTRIEPGEKKLIQLKAAKLYDYTDISIPVQVIRGKDPGPILLISGAVHGDEIIGVEIIRRVLLQLEKKEIKGTVIAVPIVNVFGFNNRSRYFMDRRELNRSFPGSKNGSQAAKLAYLFLNKIVKKSTFIIDIHTAAVHRNNLPQIRAQIDNPDIKKLATAFGAPVIVDTELIQGSLRKSCQKLGIPILLYEAGEALRFNEEAIQIGVHGILAVMSELGMIHHRIKHIETDSKIATKSHWTRAPQSGILRSYNSLGQIVKKHDLLGSISDPFSIHHTNVYAESDGLIIGQTELPLVNKGDALFHIADV